jgi:hypothetical protein
MDQTLENRQDQSVIGKLSARTQRSWTALLKSPLADRAIEEVERESIAKRSALRADLATLERKQPGILSHLSLASGSALQEFDKAEKALHEARAALATSRMLYGGAELQYLGQCKVIERSLRDTADPRLADFAFYAETILSYDMPLLLYFWISTEKNWLGHVRDLMRSNSDECLAAKEALRVAIGTVRGLQLEPLGYVDISQRLMGLCAALAPVLAKLEINPPCLSAELAQVGRAVTWAGESRWVFDELPKISPDMIVKDHKIAMDKANLRS